VIFAYIVGFILILFLGLVVIEIVYEKTNYYRNINEEFQKFKSPKKVNIVNTGSTLAFFGIDYHICDLAGLNLSLKPQSLEKDYMMLRHFSRLYNKNAIVLIVISDLAFGVSKYSDLVSEKKYYKIFCRKEIQDFSLLTALCVKYFPVTQNWRNIVRFLRDVPKNFDYELKVNENDREAVEGDAYIRCQNWCKEFNLEDLKSDIIPNTYKEKFDITCQIVSEMIEWCLSHGLRPVLVNLPMSSEMNSFFSKEFLNVFYYNNIAKANKHKIPFIDLSNEKMFSDYLLYIDSVRLNRVGREIVTKRIIFELKKMGYKND